MNAPSRCTGAKFRLRPLALEHIPDVTRWHERIDDLMLFDRRMPLPLSAAAMEGAWREIILASEPRTSYWFVIVDSEDTAVGLAGLQEINYVHGDAILAILIAEADRRNGLGTRAGALLLDAAFDQLRLTRVSTFVRADNEASQRLTTSLGFHEEGRIRKGWFADGAHTDILVIGMLCDEWRAHRETLQTKLGADICLVLGDGDSKRWSWPHASPSSRPAGVG
jgi:RimJ/RimL family protein N-acetyltransferase